MSDKPVPQDRAAKSALKHLVFRYGDARRFSSDEVSDQAFLAVEAAIDALASSHPAVPEGWQPIETAPKDGYFLVHQEGVVRLKLRLDGRWRDTEYPFIECQPWGDCLVGDDALRVLGPGMKLGVSSQCDEPTEWMPLPDAPTPPKE